MTSHPEFGIKQSIYEIFIDCYHAYCSATENY